MVYTKVYATVEDVHLSKDALKAILLLSDTLPDKNAEVWITKTEMVERLVHCGADSFLEPTDVADAMEKFRSAYSYDKRKFNGISYFRQAIYFQGSPVDQRRTSPPILPKKNYFLKKSSNKAHLKLLRDDLNRVHKYREAVQRREMTCE